MSAQAAVTVLIYGLPVCASASWQPNSPFVILADDARSAISARWLRDFATRGQFGRDRD
jgi:hypothetical protein